MLHLKSSFLQFRTGASANQDTFHLYFTLDDRVNHKEPYYCTETKQNKTKQKTTICKFHANI